MSSSLHQPVLLFYLQKLFLLYYLHSSNVLSCFLKHVVLSIYQLVVPYSVKQGIVLSDSLCSSLYQSLVLSSLKQKESFNHYIFGWFVFPKSVSGVFFFMSLACLDFSTTLGCSVFSLYADCGVFTKSDSFFVFFTSVGSFCWRESVLLGKPAEKWATSAIVKIVYTVYIV